MKLKSIYLVITILITSFMVSSCGGWSLYNFRMEGPRELSHEEQTVTYTYFPFHKKKGDYEIFQVSYSTFLDRGKAEYVSDGDCYITEWFSVTRIGKEVVVKVKENDTGNKRVIRIDCCRAQAEPVFLSITQLSENSIAE